MTMGRPPLPAEVKRLSGRSPGRDSGGRPLPDLATVSTLRQADGTPDYPEGIGPAGAALWRRAWSAAITWLSPDIDNEAVERACRLADVAAIAQQRYQATTDPKDATAVIKASHELGIALAELGFTPVSRSRLGVAEVKKISKLDELRRRNVIDAEVSG